MPQNNQPQQNTNTNTNTYNQPAAPQVVNPSLPGNQPSVAQNQPAINTVNNQPVQPQLQPPILYSF